MWQLIITFCLASACLAQSAGETFCTEIFRLYPTEFFDQDNWWETCRRAPGLDQLINELQDPMITVPDTVALSEVTYRPNATSTTGYLKVTGFHGKETFLALFDAELEKARHDDGLLLDLRGAGGGEIETACQVMARLANMAMEGPRVYKRLPGEEKTKQVAYRMQPRGEWQFELPVVILVDGGTRWPAQAILWAARERTRMETVGLPTMGTKAVEPQIVNLPGKIKIQIPTATVTTVENITMTGQSYEPDLNLNKEPLTAYRDPKDPILYRATDELYRILGRLEWLRDEMRKQLEEENRKKSGK
jgi:C-terminal processing protease CtpA/Prc